MEAYFRCLISRGMFSNEVAVRGKTAYGEEFSLFAPKESVGRSRFPPGQARRRVRLACY